MSKLALLGGSKAVQSDPGDIFSRVPPHVMKDMEKAVLDVLHSWKMSGWDITKQFEKEYAEWHGVKYALGFNTGTASIQSAMYAAGLGRGDELICPSITYWASAVQAYSLGATVVFADVDPVSLCIDPKDIEKRITSKTKAIMVVHYAGVPADMDPIMEIAKKHNLKVIEDCSHAHASVYKGKMVGTFGDVAAFSLMSGKAFAIGEAGILITNSKEIYDRAAIFGHYERHSEIDTPYLKEGIGLPWGGCKNRMHQMSSAVGLVQIKFFPEQAKEIDKAMNYFWDLIEGAPGISGHRPAKGSNSSKGGWYFPLGHYRPEELGGLSVTRFCEAVRAEGVGNCGPGCNKALHEHPLFNTIDVYGDGKPTRNAFSDYDVVKAQGSLPVSEGVQSRIYTVPHFFKFKPEIIEEHANAFKKVAENYKELLPGDKGNPPEMGGFSATFRRT